MFLFQYPATLERCPDGEVIVRFPDLRGTITGGKDEAEGMAEASDLLGSAIAHSIAEKELIPPLSALKRGQRLIAVPFWIAGKLAGDQAIQEAGITPRRHRSRRPSTSRSRSRNEGPQSRRGARGSRQRTRDGCCSAKGCVAGRQGSHLECLRSHMLLLNACTPIQKWTSQTRATSWFSRICSDSQH